MIARTIRALAGPGLSGGSPSAWKAPAIGRGFATVLLMAAVFPPCARAHWRDIPDTQVLVNQAGYDLDRPKRFLLQSKEQLPDGEVAFQLVDGEGEQAFVGRLEPSLRFDWGKNTAWYREGVFDGFRKPGTYRVRVRIGERENLSPPFEIAENLLVRKTAFLAVKFFCSQRCGSDNFLHPACHTNDAIMPDGTHRDLTGGWHDAGDYNKHHISSTLGTYALARFARSPAGEHFVLAEKGLPTARDEAVWGGTYLLKIQDPDSGRCTGAVDFDPGKLSPLFADVYYGRSNLFPSYKGGHFEYFFPPDECTDPRYCGASGIPRILAFEAYEKVGREPVAMEFPLEAGNGTYPPFVLASAAGAAEVHARLRGQAVQELKAGCRPYLDRAHEVTHIPEELRGAQCVQTLNALKDERTDGGVAFSLTRPAVVFVAFNPGGESEPDWVGKTGFSRREEALVVQGNVSKGFANRKDETWRYRVFGREFRAGEVVLGANHGAGYRGSRGVNMYAVFVKPVLADDEGAAVKAIRHRLSPIPAAPEEPVYLARRPTLRRMPEGPKNAVIFQGAPQWGEAWSLAITAGKNDEVVVCVDGKAAAQRQKLEAMGFGQSRTQPDIWSHQFPVTGEWAGGFGQANGQMGAALASLFLMTEDEKYQKAALKLWKTMVGDPQDIRSNMALLAADNELYRIRKEKLFLDDALLRVEQVLAATKENAGSAAACVLADHLLAVPDSPSAEKIRKALQEYVQRTVGLSKNPFRVPQESADLFSVDGSRQLLANARALSLCQRVLGRDAELERISISCGDWVLGLNPYGVCLMAGAGAKHMERYWHYYRPDELPGSMTLGIAIRDGYVELDVRLNQARKRHTGDGWTGEPYICTVATWLLMLADRIAY